MTYPEDSFQYIAENWWEKQIDDQPVRGSLVFAFIPHVDQVPYTVVPVGRQIPTEHTSAHVRISPLEINKSHKRAALPVAAMPLDGNEVLAAYRAKKRPCLALSDIPPSIPPKLTRNQPQKNFAPAIKVVPYYGVDRDGSRAGYPPAFVERVRHAEYRNFFWDSLPFPSKTAESLLRFDQIQPVGFQKNSFELSGWKLKEESLELLDEWFLWSLYGKVAKSGYLLAFQEQMKKDFPTPCQV